MDCKHESIFKTLLRIECLSIQGILHTVMNTAITILIIPAIPFVFLGGWVANMKGRIVWLRSVLMSPLIILAGVWYSVFSPILVAWRGFRDVARVAAMEWGMRWRTGTPKKPNGKPLDIWTDEDKDYLEGYIARSVIKDYNPIAKRYGQGIDIPDLD